MENFVGQPPKYKDADELWSKAQEYFNTTYKPTITRLCLHLGFESRQSFYDYQLKPQFTYTIKRLRTMIEAEYEDLVTDKEHATAGVIFALKNLGWSDKQEVDHTTGGDKINVVSLGNGIKPE